MSDQPILPDLTVPLPPHMGEPGITDAWQAHVDAGRIGEAAARAAGPDHGCAGLAAALGWASAAGRFAPPPERPPQA